MDASFALALNAASAAAAAQHYPQPALYLVATPIGNLADITLRALHVLQIADTLACEDTRHTQALLRAYGIERPAAHWLALHQHNENQASQVLLQRLAQGQRVACISDAGTPGISDPGARLVAAVRAAGHGVVPLPGASSLTAAVSVAGLAGDGQFVFVGFLPSKSGERQAAMAQIAAEPRAVVLLEAPHRIEALARDLLPLGTRRLTLGRELTKQFEEIADVQANLLAAWLLERPKRVQGEFVLVLHPGAAPDQASEGLRVLQLLLPSLPLKTAVRLAAEISGAARNDLYAAALKTRNGP